MSKDTVASDWTARFLRFNAHTPTGAAALAIQLSSVTAGGVFEFHLSGAASGSSIPPKLKIDVDASTSSSSAFAASSIQGGSGRARLDDEAIFIVFTDKKGRAVFDATLTASFSDDFELKGIMLLKGVTHPKSSATTASTIEIFTNPPSQPMTNQVRSLN